MENSIEHLLFELSKNLNFHVEQESSSYRIQIQKNNGWIIEVIIPKGDILQWLYYIRESATGMNLFSDRLEYYGSSPIELRSEMLTDLKAFFNIMLTSNLRIVEKHVFRIFRFKFGAVKELEFESADGWKRITL